MGGLCDETFPLSISPEAMTEQVRYMATKVIGILNSVTAGEGALMPIDAWRHIPHA
jgi:hypothetical protein